MTEELYGITKGATEYVIHCMYCDYEGVHHSHTKKTAIEVFKSNGWKICRNHAVCPKCMGVIE